MDQKAPLHIRLPRKSGSGLAAFVAVALALHVLLAYALASVPGPETQEPAEFLVLRMQPPLESATPPPVIVSASPVELPPTEEAPPVQEPEPVTPSEEPTPIAPEVLDELAQEREALRRELEAARAEIAAAPEFSPPPIPPPPSNGNLGTIRELDLSGFDEDIVTVVMAKYRLKITQRVISGGSNQNFLSSASGPEGQAYVADRSNRPGLYQVFEVSRVAMAKMSKLEEEAIRQRGLDPSSTHVKRIKFGIVVTPAGHDLGVLEFDAEPV